MSTDEKSAKWYRDNANKYTKHVRNTSESIYHSCYEKPAMYGLLPDIKGKVVLSLGCGSGEDSNYLKNQGASKSIGIDLTPELIRFAIEAYPKCDFIEMNMEKLVFPDSYFDFAYSSLAIHYVENWQKVFVEVYRVLKPKSYFIFSCNHPVKFAMDNIETEKEGVHKLEISKDKMTNVVSIFGDYISKRKIIDSLGKDTVNAWSMSFGEISKCLANAGFVIAEILEPRPTDKMKEIDLQTYNMLNKVPEFAIFKVYKA